MRPVRRLVPFVVLLTLPLATDAESAPARTQPEAPGCVKHRTEARYRNLGYDQLVHVRNTCTEPVACLVSTSVNPDPIELTLRSGEERELLTWRGSPAREFTARVACQFVKSQKSRSAGA